MPETITREQLNEAIEEFADKIMEALGATIEDEEANEPEPTGTRFKAIDINGKGVEVDAENLPPGTVVVEDVYEYFRCHQNNGAGPWIRYTGKSFTHNEFAAKMRNAFPLPRIIHVG